MEIIFFLLGYRSFSYNFSRTLTILFFLQSFMMSQEFHFEKVCGLFAFDCIKNGVNSHYQRVTLFKRFFKQ